MNEVRITAALNGFIVYVGCQTVVFNSVDRMTSELKAYCKDPAGVEKFYLDHRGPQCGPRPSQVEEVRSEGSIGRLSNPVDRPPETAGDGRIRR
jgi:hypothetical protein